MVSQWSLWHPFRIWRSELHTPQLTQCFNCMFHCRHPCHPQPILHTFLSDPVSLSGPSLPILVPIPIPLTSRAPASLLVHIGVIILISPIRAVSCFASMPAASKAPDTLSLDLRSSL
ncbi:uncharacterized protein ACHE_60923S [Aspergillus chevalieri]|uniref:Uncharacterized protein n=1 Tax=Aspergillus chevalieri TaxID=182096 RepID=A0A7R7ZS54_ASPCH|nr:uncharacterized protein ACHE_60923S [Aspergillus chevalieri]BCR91037.1 hypothetical protein ACHE_60923S [Aspergillus chevalieri]